MQVKVKKNNHFKISKRYIKNRINLTQTNKAKRAFHIKNLITIHSLYKTIISNKILHKNKNNKQEINKN